MSKQTNKRWFVESVILSGVSRCVIARDAVEGPAVFRCADPPPVPHQPCMPAFSDRHPKRLFAAMTPEPLFMSVTLTTPQ